MGSCRLFLGPGFRLGARWNRLVETVKTRKKTGKNGGKMGEIRPKTCEGRELTKDQLAGGDGRRADGPVRRVRHPRRLRRQCAPTPIPILAQVRDQQPCRSQVHASCVGSGCPKGRRQKQTRFVAAWPDFLVTQATDACVTFSKERHETSISAIKGYCRQRTTAELLEEVRPLGSASAGQCRLA